MKRILLSLEQLLSYTKGFIIFMFFPMVFLWCRDIPTPLWMRLLGCFSLSQGRKLSGFLFRKGGEEAHRLQSIAEKNIARCFPEKNIEARDEMLKNSTQSMAVRVIESFAIWSRGKFWLRCHIEIYGEVVIKTRLDAQKGVIVLIPHLGNWDLLSFVIPEFGKAIGLYDESQTASHVTEFRQKYGATLLPANHRGVAGAIKTLKEKGLVCILPDQTPRKGAGEFSPFFEHPAYTMTLVHKLIQKNQCKVVMCYVVRTASGFVVNFTEPPEKIYSTDKSESLAALNQGVEHCILQCPDQYQWSYPRFDPPEMP